MKYDDDDPVPNVTLADIYWHYANRISEHALFYARLCGWKEAQVILRCEDDEVSR